MVKMVLNKEKTNKQTNKQTNTHTFDRILSCFWSSAIIGFMNGSTPMRKCGRWCRFIKVDGQLLFSQTKFAIDEVLFLKLIKPCRECLLWIGCLTFYGTSHCR